MASPMKILEERTQAIDPYASQRMKQFGNYLWERIQEKLPSNKRVRDKLLDGKIYSAIISADTEMNTDVLKKIASKLADQLAADEAWAFAPLSLKHHVEAEEICANGLLRVVRFFDVTTSRMLVAFEVAAGRDPEVEVEIKVTPL